VIRRIGAVLAGLAIAIAIIMACEMIPHALYPPPPGMDMMDLEQVKPYLAKLPATAFLIVLIGHLAATLAGTAATAGIAKSRQPAYVLGTLLFAGGIYNAVKIPQPVWFSVASFAIYIIATMVGARLAAPRRSESAA
jgi:ABC-type transport system involved in multi-copper enzyme maturation permease subunit